MSAIVRILWFLFVGWWLGPLWFVLSVFLMGSIVFFPIGAYAASKTWTVMTFKSSPTVVVKNVQSEAR